MRDIFKEMEEDECKTRFIPTPTHERVLFYCDPEVPVKIIIAIHNTNAGPAMGGCRMWDYDTLEAMYKDALGLSWTMTWKAIFAGIHTGGGKMLVWADPNNPTTKSPELFQAIARALDFINKDKLVYITGEDAGMTVNDIEKIAEYVKDDRCIGGRAISFKRGSRRGSGDSSVMTAVGIIHGMKAAAKFLDGKVLDHRTIAIQGFGGKVGRSLAKQLREEFPDIKLLGSELEEYIDERLIFEAEQLNLTIVSSDEIHKSECDIFAPCALQVTLNEENVHELRCKIVAGAQNNQLATSEIGYMLRDLGILYVPDYIINAGGLINIADEALGEGAYNNKRVLAHVEKIGETVLLVLRRARRENRPTNVVADEMADEMVAALAK